MSGDPDIRVELTGLERAECFQLELGPDVTVWLHARSMQDLIAKCSLAYLDWIAAASELIVEELAR